MSAGIVSKKYNRAATALDMNRGRRIKSSHLPLVATITSHSQPWTKNRYIQRTVPGSRLDRLFTRLLLYVQPNDPAVRLSRHPARAICEENREWVNSRTPLGELYAHVGCEIALLQVVLHSPSTRHWAFISLAIPCFFGHKLLACLVYN